MEEVLGEMALVEVGLLYHLTLRNGILVHVLLDCLGNQGLVTALEGGREGEREGLVVSRP